MSEITIFQDLLRDTKSYETPPAPPPTAQERVAEIPGKPDMPPGFLEQFMYGKLTEAAPTPGAEFENFFRSRYSPAQEFISNFIRGGMASRKGVEASTVREESLKEFQIFQRDKQASEEAKLRTLGILSQLSSTQARLELEAKKYKTEAEMEAIRHEWDRTKTMASWARDASLLELAQKKGEQDSAESKTRIEKMRLEMEQEVKVNPNGPIGVTLRLFQEANEGRLPTTSEEIAKYQNDVEAMATALKGKQTGIGTGEITESAEALASIFAQTGDMNILNHKSALPHKNAILGKLIKENAIVGMGKESFRKAINPSMIAAGAFSDYNQVLLTAKGKNANAKDSYTWQKAAGFLSRLEGTLGTDAYAAVLGKIRGALATTLAKAFGEQRVTDADIGRFIQLAASQDATFKEIEQIINFQKRRFYNVILTEVQGLTQLGDPPQQGDPIPLEEIDEYLAAVNEKRKVAGASELNVADFIKMSLESGQGFK